MIIASNLAIGYGTTQIAAGIDLSIVPGEILCLLGPNAAGKTTLFKTLLGLIPALGGRVEIGGRPLADLSRAALARAVAYVPQTQVMEFAYTVLDLVLMGRTAHLGPFAAPGAIDLDRARAALDELGILDLADREANRLSGGQRQLCLIARALAQDAPVMVMDEPTASLDLGNRFLVLARVQALRERGFGVIFSTHDPDQARELATRVAVIADHRLAAYGPPEDTLTAATLSEVYGVRVTLDTTSTGRIVVAPASGPLI